MRPLRNNKNLHNIAQPLLLPSPLKHHSQAIKQHVTISYSHCLIINSSSLPLQFQLQTMQNLIFYISITHERIEVRNTYFLQNLPLRFEPKQWVKIDFGENMKSIQIKPLQKENKFIRIPIYSSEETWRKSKYLAQGSLKEISLKRPIVYLKNGITRQILDDPPTPKIPQQNIQKVNKIMKNRINSTVLRPKLLSLRERSVNMSERSTQSKELVQKIYQKKKSRKNSSEKQRNQSQFKKRSLTSNNSPHPPNCLPRQQTRFNITKRLKLSNFRDQIQLIQPRNKRFSKKPKFYQKIPLTFQQIELKRKKFDSQFIPSESNKINIDLNNELKTEQSAIIEDICIKEESHFSNFQDTFQKGVEKSNRPARDISESGTLCQSVFQ